MAVLENHPVSQTSLEHSEESGGFSSNTPPSARWGEIAANTVVSIASWHRVGSLVVLPFRLLETLNGESTQGQKRSVAWDGLSVPNQIQQWKRLPSSSCS